MANTFASTSNALGILKNYYADGVKSQFNDNCPLYSGAETGKEKWSGLQVIRALKVRRNPGIGATSDGGALPPIGKQNVQQAAIASKFNYLRFGVTGPMIAASQGKQGAFVRIVEYEMEEGINDMKTSINRQLFWTGRGDLATVSAAVVASNTVTATGRTSGEDGSKYLDIGSVIDIVDPATSVYKIVGATVTAITTGASATVVLDQVVTCAANDIFVTTGAFNNEIQGIRTLLDNATTSVYSIDRSIYPAFNGNVIDLGAGQLRLDALQQALNLCRSRGGLGPDAIFCDFNSERFYNKLLVADRRYIGQKVIGDGTFTDKDKSYLEFSGAPVVADKDCTANEIYFMTKVGWKKYVLGEELQWVDDSGSYMITQVGSDAYEVRLRLFVNMFPEKPSAMARLTNYVSP